MIFPEGGIVSKAIPQMRHPFKDGAFIMAIQQQVPIVPITLLTNYQILPDVPKVRMHRYPLRAVIHPPIATTGLTQEDVETVKEQTYQIIQNELLSNVNN
jgi:1-acyl-sn-glycerol-3-phosphate acyltransferase